MCFVDRLNVREKPIHEITKQHEPVPRKSQQLRRSRCPHRLGVPMNEKPDALAVPVRHHNAAADALWCSGNADSRCRYVLTSRSVVGCVGLRRSWIDVGRAWRGRWLSVCSRWRSKQDVEKLVLIRRQIGWRRSRCVAVGVRTSCEERSGTSGVGASD